MLPMSSSRSHNTPQRSRSGKPDLSNSFMGSFRNMVTGFSGLFGRNGSRDPEESPGKRRLLGQSGSQSTDGDQPEDSARSKRIRVDSPPSEPQLACHLDSPGSVIQPTQSNGLSMSPESQQPFTFPVGSSSHLSIPTNTVPNRSNRRTLPQRHSSLRGLSRTMSMDPPSFHSQSHVDTTPKPSYRPTPTPTRDVSMRASQPPSSYVRDVSMFSARESSVPPSSYHPYLRMRNSMSVTPQPHGRKYGPGPALPPPIERDQSEPPDVTNVMSIPTLVKIPSEAPQSPEQPAVTLGTLVSQRRARSPSNHRSLFGPQSETPASILQAPHAPQKVFRDLDAYRSSNAPSGLRESSADPMIIPNVLRPGFVRERTPVPGEDVATKRPLPRLGNHVKKSSRAKPYTGEGALKRLLNRRKEETDEQELAQAKPLKSTRDASVLTEPEPVAVALPPAPAPVSAPTASVPSRGPPAPLSRTPTPNGLEQSSLRVGRARAPRNNVTRPASRPNKVKFSASYEDEEALDEDARQREREREMSMLNEAAKNVPEFKIPADFSFLKEGPIVPPITSDSKEPPIEALPFSFTKPSTAPPSSQPGGPQQQQAKHVPTSVFGTSISTSSTAPPSAPPPLKDSQPGPAIAETDRTTAAPSSTGGSIPNFFTGSSVFTKPAVSVVDTAAPPPSAFRFTPSTIPAEPIKDAANPLWEGAAKVQEKKDQQLPPALLPSPFDFGKKKASAESTTPAPSLFTPPASGVATPPPTSMFGNGVSLAPSPILEMSGPDTEKGAVDKGVPVPFASLGAATTSPFTFGAPTTPSKPVEQALVPATPAPAAITTPTETPKPSSVFASPAPFGGFGAPSSTTPASEPPKHAFSFGPTTTTPGAAAPALVFGQAAAAPARTEVPKLSFGGASGGFSFGQTTNPAGASTAADVKEPRKATTTTPFAFAAASTVSPSTPVAVEPEKKSMFTFGAGSAAATATAASAPAVAPTKPAFTFGAPSVAAPAAPTKPAFNFGGSGSGASVPAPFSFGAVTGTTTSGTTDTSSSKPFVFGSSAMTSQPVTPPRTTIDLECRMEESPSREMQINNIHQNKNGLDKLPNGFGSPGGLFSDMGASPLGPAQNGIGSSSLFSFGGAPKTDSQSMFTSPTPAHATPAFSFGAKAPTIDTTRPASAPTFSFNLPTPTSAGPSFTFGGGGGSLTTTPTNAAGGGGPFGQQQQTASGPNSPSTFGQAGGSNPFAFSSTTTPTTTTGTGSGAPAFTFGGSQPASPASAGGSLPQTSGGGAGGGGGFTFGSGTSQSSSLFAPPAPSGGALFTIGAPPPAQPGQAGSRQIKKLPNRRGGKR